MFDLATGGLGSGVLVCRLMIGCGGAVTSGAVALPVKCAIAAGSSEAKTCASAGFFSCSAILL